MRGGLTRAGTDEQPVTAATDAQISDLPMQDRCNNETISMIRVLNQELSDRPNGWRGACESSNRYRTKMIAPIHRIRRRATHQDVRFQTECTLPILAYLVVAPYRPSDLRPNRSPENNYGCRHHLRTSF